MAGRMHEAIGKGRRGTGFGQRQVIEEEHAHAVRLFGRTFVEHHLEAVREGRTKMTLRDLILARQKAEKMKEKEGTR